ncbi:MAG: hypothetical protein N2663_07270 [Chlorobi bacterium]|nr:hypothetical protein [Chlorobiota bacterium]
MKTLLTPATFVLLLLWIGGCADPSGIAPPVVENPKPVEVAITPDHLEEAGSNDEVANDKQENKLALASHPDLPWSNPADRSFIVLDTVRQRILRMRLSLVPRVALRDTMTTTIRRIIVELDSNAAPALGHSPRYNSKGEAIFIVREVLQNRQIVYRAIAVRNDTPDVPDELHDSVYCKVQAWLTDKKAVILTLSIQHYILDERSGMRKLRRMRASALLEIPIPRS